MPPTVRSLRRGWRRFRAFWFAHMWLAFATTAIGLVGIVVVFVLAPSRPDPANPGETEIYGWGIPAVLFMALLLALGLASIVSRYSRESRPQRISRLSTALQEAESIIAEINREMEEGAERLAELEKQTAMHQRLAELSGDEATAVRGAVEAALGEDRRRIRWKDVALGAVLGGAVTYLVERFV